MWQVKRFKPRDRHDQACKCDHPRVAHYSKEGNCVLPGCGCRDFRPKGRPEYQSKRMRCEYAHAHDSGLEVKACFDLHLQKIAGTIRDYAFHKVLNLLGPSGSVVATYEIDFVVEHIDETIEYIECKGKHLEQDPTWRLKWKLLQDKHKNDYRYKFTVIRG